MTARPTALWRCTDLSRFATAADGMYYVCHASENSPRWMKHFTACNIQFPECRRLALFGCVMTILTSWKACVVIIETTCPVKIFAQCVCWELLHPITPSVSSMWFLLSSTYILYLLVFLFFVMISLIGNTIVGVLLYSVDRNPPALAATLDLFFIRSDRVWLSSLLDSKNSRYRHRNRLLMLLGSKTAGYLIFWRLC